MPASKDSLSYVKPVPLPIQSSKGLRILARDTINFNPEFPSRDEVRKNNYYRRQTQMSSMGFRSANHKPYMGIGDPFYLDEKKMILHALGQWSEEYASSSSSEEESDDNDDNKDKTPKPAFTAAKFVLRRSRKDLNTLNKAVVHGRNMIRNVSLGHGLFDLINKEKQTKTAASEAEFRKRQEQLRNEFQPPKNESDDSDEDLENEVDLSSYMVPVAQPTFLTQQTDTDEELGIVNDNAASESDQSPEREAEFVTFSGMKMAEEEEEFQRSRSAAVTSAMTSTYSRPTSRRKKKQETPRPYTPQHTNLSANLSTRESLATDGETDMDITKDALFRQLCVLHWILEAMSTDPPSPMTPIMSCWSLTEIGGARAQPKKLQKDKVTEQGWANFLSKDTSRNQSFLAKVSKRLSSQRMSRSPHIRRPLHTPGRNSGQSSATGSQQGSTTGLNTVASQMSMLNVRNRAGMDEEPLSPKPEEDDDQAYNKSIFKFLDEYYESLKNEEDKNNKQLATKSPSSTPPTSPTPDKQKKEEKKKKKKKKRENSAGQKEKRLDHKVAVALGEEEKMSSKYLRANAHLIRAKSSPALVEFQNTLPSNKRGVLTADLHNQFAECREEKALTLHDILDHKEGQRMTVCKSKFLSFGGLIHGSSFHRAVKEMRLDSHQRLRTPVSEQKKQTSKGNWYTDLMDKIPEELKHEWYYNKILQKLGNFGLILDEGISINDMLSVEGTGKQSIYKFIKVLEGLREWEICSPDITAAIEFCRERIVEMTIEEYESWFTQRFPKITRPQTAPPVQKTEKKESVLGSASTVRRVMPKRPTQSAFVRRVQR